MKPSFQTTLRDRVSLSAALAFIPASLSAWFSILPTPIPAWSFCAAVCPTAAAGASKRTGRKVTMTELCTVIGDGAQHMVSTIEHLVAALNGLGVDNCLVEVDGPEVPIMDGSAAAFVEAIDRVGVRHLAAPRRFVKILKTVRVEHGRAFSELRPAASGFRLDVEIDFNSDVIGRQRKILDLEPAGFRREISRARTFGFLADVERLVKAGFALGASLDNSVGIDDERMLNPKACAIPTNSCATRCWTLSATWPWPARR